MQKDLEKSLEKKTWKKDLERLYKILDKDLKRLGGKGLGNNMETTWKNTWEEGLGFFLEKNMKKRL